MIALAELSAPINDFFDKVVVNSEEEAIRLNRLASLGQTQSAMSEIADFNQLEGACVAGRAGYFFGVGPTNWSRDRVMSKWVYSFGADKCDGDATMRNLLGGKALIWLKCLYLPLPPGFTITTEVCTYYTTMKNLPGCAEIAMEDALKAVEAKQGGYSGIGKPPLVSVRSERGHPCLA